MATGRVVSVPFVYQETDWCVVADDYSNVNFINFDVNQAVPRAEHLYFISAFVVPHYIKQIEQIADPDMQTMTLHAYGRASATGNKSNNDTLSVSRAQAIGDAVIRAFDQQKSRSKAAAGITAQIDASGGGDDAARAVREAAELQFQQKFSDASVEKAQFAYRSAGISLIIDAEVTDEYYNYHARQIYELGLKRDKVPANLLEQKLDELDSKIGPVAKWFGGAAITAIIWRLKKVYKYQLKNFLKNAGRLVEEIPELKWLLFLADFVVAEDVAQLFEFKDHRNVHAIYKYEGDAHTKDIKDSISIVMYVLGIRRYLRKAEDGLKKALVHPLATPMKPEIKEMLDEVVAIRIAFDAQVASISRKGGALRDAIGDTLTDALVKLIMEEEEPPPKLRIPLSPWSAPFSFYDHKFYDVKSFAGPARTQSYDVLFKSHITLDFAGQDDYGYLGYGAQVDVVSDVSFRNSALSGSITNGRLRSI